MGTTIESSWENERLKEQLAAAQAREAELLAALKGLVAWADDLRRQDPVEDLRRARAALAKTQPLLGTHCDIGESFYKGRIFQDAEGTIPVTESGQPVGAIRDENGEIAMRCYGATLCTDEDHRPVIQIGEKND